MAAYRCADCRWWKTPAGASFDGQEYGSCDQADRQGSRLQTYPPADVLTSPDFGCVQFERREHDRG